MKDLRHFPDEFLWGAATSAHQTEGNNVNSNWWHMETAPNSPFKDRSGPGIDAYHRYPQDMALLAEAGLNAYRFSIEWARIEPRPGEFSKEALDHYRDMVATAIDLGLTPVVTLHHFTNPMWFSQRGGWAAADAADCFARYAAKTAEILGDVPWICTINEPNMIALLAEMPARLAGGGTASTALDDRPIAGLALKMPSDAVTSTLTEAHRRAVEVLRVSTDAKLGWTVSGQGFEAQPGSEDVLAAVKWAWEDRYLEVAREDDFVGVQSYTTRLVGPDGLQPYSAMERETMTGWPIRPDAVGTSVRNAWEVTGGTPILVTENGIATSDDTVRVAYIDGAIDSLGAAIKGGADVRGYLHWSAFDNYEWGEWGPTFGLVAVDRQTFARTPRPSLHWYGSAARAARTERAALRP
jgi:beta-glucosidase